MAADQQAMSPRVQSCKTYVHLRYFEVLAMEVSELLRRAWTAVEEAGLPEKIHEVAFREAMRVLIPGAGGTSVTAVRPAKPSRAVSGTGGSRSAGAGSDGDGGINVTEGEIFDKVVEHTGVDRDKLDKIVHLDGEVLRVSIPGIRLGKNNAEKTRVVAQILTIVRGFGLDENETSLEVIRAEATRLKCYDTANFSSHVAKLSGYVITGSGANRRIRAKAGGIQAFPALVEKLSGES
jgi:hypothetical protein